MCSYRRWHIPSHPPTDTSIAADPSRLSFSILLQPSLALGVPYLDRLHLGQYPHCVIFISTSPLRTLRQKRLCDSASTSVSESNSKVFASVSAGVPGDGPSCCLSCIRAVLVLAPPLCRAAQCYRLPLLMCCLVVMVRPLLPVPGTSSRCSPRSNCQRDSLTQLFKDTLSASSPCRSEVWSSCLALLSPFLTPWLNVSAAHCVSPR